MSEKWREMTSIEDYEFDPDGKYDGSLGSDDWDEIFTELYQRAETTEEYLYNKWIDPVSTRNAYTYKIDRNGEHYIVMKYYDGMYALYEIKDSSEIDEEKRTRTATVIEKITKGVSVRQAILESVLSTNTLFEDVAGMTLEEHDSLMNQLDEWTGGSGKNGWEYHTVKTSGDIYTINLKKNPVVQLENDGKTVSVAIDAENNVLNGEVYCAPADEYLAASGPVSMNGLKSVLRDLLSQWEMALQEISNDNASDSSGDLYGF